MSSAQFKLDMFEGPLDLLLHLISKHKLNIHDIQISLLLEQYLEYIHQLDHEDLEDAADFLEMAARLIYIKTVSLLPQDEEAQELKKELEGRLIEYSQCKYLAGILAKGYVGGEIFVRKPEPVPVDKTYTREHDAEILLDAYLGLSEKARSEKPVNAKIFQPLVSHKIVSIGTKIVYILKKLYTDGICDLSHIYDGMSSKSERVATFLAILELTKSGRIVLNDDNTQIAFSEKSRDRKKNRRGEAEQSDAPSEDTEITDDNTEMAEIQEPAAPEIPQDIPEFKPDDIVHMPPEPKAERYDKPKTTAKQATERIAEPRSAVLELPVIPVSFPQTTLSETFQTENETEQTEQAEQPAQAEQVAAETVVVEAVQTEDEPEPTEQTEQQAKAEQVAPEAVVVEAVQTEDKPEPTEQTEQQAQAEQVALEAVVVEAVHTEDEPEPTEQTEQPAQAEQVAAETVVVEAVQTEDEPEPIEQTEQQAQAEQEVPEIVEEEPAVTEETPIQLYEPALDVVCEELPREDTEQCDVPFKPNYWNVLRYYWGSTAVGDNAPRNYWRYGKARL